MQHIHKMQVIKETVTVKRASLGKEVDYTVVSLLTGPQVAIERPTPRQVCDCLFYFSILIS